MNVESSEDQRRKNWDCRNIKRNKKRKIKRGKNNKGKESGRRIGDLE